MTRTTTKYPAVWVPLGALLCLCLGAVIGFWLEVLTTPELPNGFYHCKDCGADFRTLYREGWFR